MRHRPMAHTRTRQLLATHACILRSSTNCHHLVIKFALGSARNTRVLPEPSGDGLHESPELLNAEQPRAERVKHERTATSHYRGDKAVNGALMHERPHDCHNYEREQQAGNGRYEHPDKR